MHLYTRCTYKSPTYASTHLNITFTGPPPLLRQVRRLPHLHGRHPVVPDAEGAAAGPGAADQPGRLAVGEEIRPVGAAAAHVQLVWLP